MNSQDALASAAATPPRRRWIKRICFGVVTLAVITLLTEVILRVGWGFGNPPLLQVDPEIGYLFRPDQEIYRFGNRVKINRYHQRSEEVSPTPETGTVRVMCVGDSVTWGGVWSDQAETYPEILAASLRTKLGIPVEALNASAGSWGVGNEAAYLARFGTFGSRWVVLQIGSDDLTQPTSTGVVVGVDPRMPSERPLSAIGELLGRSLGNTGAATNPSAPVNPPEDQLRMNLDHLRSAVRTARATGAEVVILHTPNRDEVVDLRGTGYATRHDWARSAFQKVCQEMDVRVVDLHARWRGQADASMYFRDSIHPNPTGNREVAQAVAEALHGEKHQ